MGTWGTTPWDSDSAADWFAATMEKSGLAVRIEETLHLDLEEYFENVRAAAAVLVLLGHNYIWPIDDLDRHLELAASKLEEILAQDLYEGNENANASIKAEIAVLRSRLGGGAQQDSANPEKWWRF